MNKGCLSLITTKNGMAKNVYLDTETSGFKPGQIGQLSMIIEDKETGKLEGKNYYFKIKYLSPGAAKACGRTIEFYSEASGGKKFADYSDEIITLIEDSNLVAHNASFDWKFLKAEFEKVGIGLDSRNIICCDSLKEFKEAILNSGHSLDELVKYFNICPDKIIELAKELFDGADGNISLHDSMYDTTALFLVCKIYYSFITGETKWVDLYTY